ncbi:MAG: BtpA/SgcQ family protein [Bacillota bacterium]|nr:BtpA/SgcQ family protein [Bacillota bacterium]
MLGREKPVIAMAHFPPLPGSPLYDRDGGLAKIRRHVADDLAVLVDCGVDAVLFCNEGDRPYTTRADPATLAVMASVVGRLTADLRLPFGVDILWDPKSALALAVATGAGFVREVFTGVYPSDMGLWDTSCGESLRYRRQIDAAGVRLFFNINAEFAGSFDRRPLPDVARSVVFSSLADAVCVSGPMTGEPAALTELTAVKKALPDVPVIANTGIREETVAAVLEIADAVIVGTALKVDGRTFNPVDAARVRRFMRAARGRTR